MILYHKRANKSIFLGALIEISMAFFILWAIAEHCAGIVFT